ncbi:MAG: inositol monophosphatase [Planctomycetes bacterium]|nr:inositol monophosphatase [Planctomycetota bacterium]
MTGSDREAPALRPLLPPSESRAALRGAVEIATRAGALLRRLSRRRREVRFKGRINMVTDADRAAQTLCRDFLKRRFPSYGLLAEEGIDEGRGAECRWVLDPLDGTTNYAHGLPLYCVSLALAVRGRVEVGVVFCPPLGECFAARRGGGARLNGRRLHVSPVNRLLRAILVTGFPYDIRHKSGRAFHDFAAVCRRALAVRRFGSAAIDLSYVACGRFDAFWELRLNPWDTAAGALLVEEAGGSVTSFSGRPYRLDDPDILATNGSLHPALRRLLTGPPEALARP